MKIKNRKEIRYLIETILLNEFVGDLTKVASKTLKDTGIDTIASDALKATGVNQIGIDQFKVMFPKSETFLKYLDSKDVDETDFIIPFGMVLIEKAAASGVDIPSSINSPNDKLADIVAESVLETLEGMNVKFGAEIFGKTIPGTDTLEKNKLKDETRTAVKDAIKNVLIKGENVNMPTGINESLSRGSLYRMKYYGRY